MKSVKSQVKSLYFAFTLSLVTCHLSPVSAAFKDSGWGARASGMGGAHAAVADDSESAFYNPAGLAALETSELSVMYAQPFAGLDLKAGDDSSTSLGMNRFSAAAPLGRWGALGVSWTSLNVTSLYREDAYILTYGKKVGDKLRAGINLKSLSTKFTLDDLTRTSEAASAQSPFKDGTSASAFSVDLGLQANPAEPLWLGFSLRNANSPDIGLTQKDSVPRELRIGAAWKAGTVGAFEDVLSTLEISRRAPKGNETETRPLFGVETWFKDRTYALRLGGSDREMTLGTSFNHDFRHASVRLDYAFAWSSTIDENSGTHRLAITLRGGRTGDTALAKRPKKQRVFSRKATPFGPGTRTVEVFDTKGEELWTAKGDGRSSLSWPGVDKKGRPVKKDAYIYKTREADGEVGYGVILLEE